MIVWYVSIAASVSRRMASLAFAEGGRRTVPIKDRLNKMLRQVNSGMRFSAIDHAKTNNPCLGRCCVYTSVNRGALRRAVMDNKQQT